MPKFNHAELDLHLVFVTVQSVGGYEGVTREKRWKRVCEALGQDLTTATSAGHTMRKNYEKVLLEFEVHLAEREGTPRVVPDAIDVANPALANDWNGNEDGRNARPGLRRRVPDLTETKTRMTRRWSDFDWRFGDKSGAGGASSRTRGFARARGGDEWRARTIARRSLARRVAEFRRRVSAV